MKQRFNTWQMKNKNGREMMKINALKKLGLVLVSVLTFSDVSVAVENDVETKIASDTVQLVNIAGRQRMLSQRIAKDYMYAGNNVAVSKAQKQLVKSLEELKEAHAKLSESINDPEIQNLLLFVGMSAEDFEATSKEAFNTDNAQIILDLSESMLEGSQYVVDSLSALAKVKSAKIVDIAGRQRMLSQRIAKYYIAYQSGIKDKNTVEQMQAAVKLFADSHDILMKNETNTPEINRKLNEIDRLWRVVYKFYLNIEKGGLPLIVFNTTDDITKKMNEITGHYVELNK